MAVTAISVGSLVPKALAPRRPSPAGRTFVVHNPLAPRVWMSHQRTWVVSPAAIVKEVGPSECTSATRGGAGALEPSHGNAGTSAFSTYAELARSAASRSLLAN